MELIPVIDLLGGKAVKAEHGDRARYRPLSSQLSPSPEPEAVLAAFLKLHPFRTVYIADLDAIERHGSNATVLRRLRARPSAAPGSRRMVTTWCWGARVRAISPPSTR